MKHSLEHLHVDLMQLAHRELDLTDDVSLDNLAEELDSMQRLALVVAIEDHYEICFDPDDEEDIVRFTDVVTLVHRKLQEFADHVA